MMARFRRQGWGRWGLVLLMALRWCVAPTLAAAAPVHTRSWYVRSTDPTLLGDEGCATAKTLRGAAPEQRFALLLVFGGVTTNGAGEIVFDLYRDASASVVEVSAAVSAYVSGYERCSEGAVRVPLTLVVGTTTSRGIVSRAVGAGFATAIDRIVAAVGNQSGVTLLGGNDLELGYIGPTAARAWVDGYHGATSLQLANYGDLAGCPADRLPRLGDCGTPEHPEWSAEDVWHVAGHPDTVNFPTIYVTSGVQARQWRNLSRYGAVRHGRPLKFLGTLSQIAACEVRPCSRRARNTPGAAWQQLQSQLAADPALGDPDLAASDIAWMAAPPGTTDDGQLADAEHGEQRF